MVQILLYLLGRGLNWPALGRWDDEFDLADAGSADVLTFALWWLYGALCESSEWQATPGKKALGLKVTDESGQRIDFTRATLRFFCQILSGLLMGIGYLMAAFTARKQALHDMLARTLVVRD